MRLPEYIETSGIKRVELARKIGCSPAQITLLCRAGAYPKTLDEMLRIMKATGYSVLPNDWLPEQIRKKVVGLEAKRPRA